MEAGSTKVIRLVVPTMAWYWLAVTVADAPPICGTSETRMLAGLKFPEGKPEPSRRTDVKPGSADAGVAEERVT
jgi:hypothetical protein